MSKFPFHVLTDILYCLPVESLLRFRCLSKTCCSFIDNPDFVKLHIDHSLKTGTNHSLIVDYVKPYASIYAMDLDFPDTYPVELDCPFRSCGTSITSAKPHKYCSDVVGSCNGLLALYHPRFGMALWNPSTKKHLMLPNFWDCIYSTEMLFDGFGYDAISDDYKVIRIIQGHMGRSYRGWVYSLKASSSRSIKDFPHYSAESRYSAILVGASLHWVAFSGQDNFDDRQIHAFNLGDERFHLVPMPALGKCSFITVGVLGGCLSMGCKYEYDGHVEIWMMKEYGVEKSWTKLFSLLKEEHDIPDFCRVHMKPLGYSKTGDKVLLEQDEHYLYWYDLEKKSLQRIENLGGFSIKMYSSICVKSLVPLNVNGAIAYQSNKRGRTAGKKSRKKRGNVRR